MKCKYCGSKNLKVIQRGPHLELNCGDCLKYQRFISKKEARRLLSKPLTLAEIEEQARSNASRQVAV